MKLHVSGTIISAAKEVLKHNMIIHQGDRFEVFEIPTSLTMLSGYALLLFRENHDFLVDGVPKDTMFLPARIEKRQGYFIGREVALKYSQD